MRQNTRNCQDNVYERWNYRGRIQNKVMFVFKNPLISRLCGLIRHNFYYGELSVGGNAPVLVLLASGLACPGPAGCVLAPPAGDMGPPRQGGLALSAIFSEKSPIKNFPKTKRPHARSTAVSAADIKLWRLSFFLDNPDSNRHLYATGRNHPTIRGMTGRTRLVATQLSL